jgi:beta-lactamase regulating signal transducer with metallopeptidase domain
MTVVGWMVYAMAVGLLLAPAAWLLERGVGRVGAPTRWVWAGSLLLCVGLPGAAAVRGPSGPEEVGSVSVPTTVITTAASAAGAVAEPRRAMDTFAASIARWRAELDRLVAAGSTVLTARRPALARWLAVGWGAASAMLATFLLISVRRLSRRAAGWPRRAHLGRQVRLAPELGPATLGLVRPQIVLPTWAVALPAQQLELILTHEEEHVRARDPLLLAIGLACAVACPWNPLLWWQHRRLRDAVEVDCDQRVLRRGAAPPTYGDLLVSIGSRRQLAWVPATTMTGTRSLLERRLEAMKKTTLRAALPRTIGATVLAAGLIVVACTTEPPIVGEEPSAVQSVVEGNQRVADVWVQPDGQIYINGIAYRMEDVSDALGELDAASDEYLILSIQADPAVPYGVMHDLQQQARAAEVVRVTFATRTTPRRTPPGDPNEMVEGLGLVLPEAGAAEPVSGRNLLHLEVRPSGVVEARRGVSPEVQRLRPAAVEALWRQEVARNPNLIAAVKVHPDASYTHMVEVLDALHAAAARRISIQTLTEPETQLQ